MARAESSGLSDASADLVAIAQALHWLDTKSFYSEAQRVLAPGGAIAVWGYGDPVLETPELDQVLHAFNRGTIESYWLPERKLLLDGYRTVPFPFREVMTPAFELARGCTLAQLMGYVRTWSATARYVAVNGTAAVERLQSDLARHWGDPDRPRLVEAPMFLRVGYLRD